MIDKKLIVEQARAWIGTPYRHQARIRGIGVDCIGLIIGVARELEIVPADFDVNGYRRMPDGYTLMEKSYEYMEPVVRSDMEPGDVVVVSFFKDPQHFGIIGDYRHGGLSIIHAAATAGSVIETRLMFSETLRFNGAFKFKAFN